MASMVACVGCGAAGSAEAAAPTRAPPIAVRDGGGDTPEEERENTAGERAQGELPEESERDHEAEVYEPPRIEKPRPVVEPEVPPECVIEDEGADIHPFLARYREKLCTWLEPKERVRLERVDLSGTGGGDAEALALVVRDEALRKLAPPALARAREKMLRSFARALRSARKGSAALGYPMLGACHGDPLYEACGGDCDWEEGQPCRRCLKAARQFEPLRLMCGPLSTERLIWEGTPAMGEGEIPASGRAHFTSVLDASVKAGVPRRRVVRFAIGLLEELAARASSDHKAF
jgi:hypothetical protein